MSHAQFSCALMPWVCTIIKAYAQIFTIIYDCIVYLQFMYSLHIVYVQFMYSLCIYFCIFMYTYVYLCCRLLAACMPAQLAGLHLDIWSSTLSSSLMILLRKSNSWSSGGPTLRLVKFLHCSIKKIKHLQLWRYKAQTGV